MTSESPTDEDAESLLRLSDEVIRIAGSLVQLSTALRAPFQQHLATNPNETEISAESVNRVIRARRNRARYLPPDLFADPAWDMLLDLLHTELAGGRVSVSSLCIASGVPPTTGLRWLKTLETRGLVLRKFDQHDARRTFVELSPETSNALRRYFLDIVEPPRADQR